MKKHIKRTPTAGMSRADWLTDRRRSLGGSDMGAVLGLNPWRSPYAVWAEKTGRVVEDRETEAMRIGRDLEDYVAQRFCEASGYTVRKVNALLRNPNYPCLHANVDREIAGIHGILECKTTSALNEKAFAGGYFPESYYAQCVTYLAVTEYERCYLAVLVMGREFKIYQMTRDPDEPCPDWCAGSTYVSQAEIDALADAARRFWELVERDEPPAVDGSEATTEALQVIYADSRDEVVEIWSSEVRAAVRAYLKLKAEEKEREKLLKAQANIIREYLGDSEGGVCEDGKVSWKPQTRETIDRKRLQAEHPEIDLAAYTTSTVSRVLKVTAAKGKSA